jgi:hypothetical protein
LILRRKKTFKLSSHSWNVIASLLLARVGFGEEPFESLATNLQLTINEKIQ